MAEVKKQWRHGSETWCLRENEMAILRRTKRAMVRACNVWCKTDGEKEDRVPNGDVGIEGNSGSEGKGRWSKIVQACVEG